MLNIKAVSVSEKAIEFNDNYAPDSTKMYLELAKEIAKKGINPITKKWVFKDKTFENLMALTSDGLTQYREEAAKARKDVERLEIIEELEFGKGYIRLHKDVPDEIIIDVFRTLPTLWHLQINVGKKTWANISAFASEYFGKLSSEKLKKLTMEYMEEGEEE